MDEALKQAESARYEAHRKPVPLGPTDTASPLRSRWAILAAAVLVQLALGAIYCWTLWGAAFSHHASTLALSASQAQRPFEIALGVVCIGAWVGGRLQDRHGPRIASLVGGSIYAFGVLTASTAHEPGQL